MSFTATKYDPFATYSSRMWLASVPTRYPFVASHVVTSADVVPCSTVTSYAPTASCDATTGARVPPSSVPTPLRVAEAFISLELPQPNDAPPERLPPPQKSTEVVVPNVGTVA